MRGLTSDERWALDICARDPDFTYDEGDPDAHRLDLAYEALVEQGRVWRSVREEGEYEIESWHVTYLGRLALRVCPASG